MDHAKLREIAEKATPGPWSIAHRTSSVVLSEALHTVICDCRFPTLAVLAGFDTTLDRGAEANAAHIAAFDPPTILALLDEIARLREALRPFAACCHNMAEIDGAKLMQVRLSDCRRARAALEHADG